MLNINTVLLLLASLTIFLGIFHMPYGYYDFLRVVATAAFSYIAYCSYTSVKNHFVVAVSAMFIIAFNPLFKIGFNRDIWLYLDTIASIFIIIYLFVNNKFCRVTNT